MAVPPGDPATWQAITGDAAGVLDIIAERVEGPIAGGLTRAARQMAAAAHRPGESQLCPGATADDLRGVAVVAAQAFLPGGPPPWLCLLGQMQRLVSAIGNAEEAGLRAGAVRGLADEAARELERVHQGFAGLPGHRGSLEMLLCNQPTPPLPPAGMAEPALGA